MTTSDLTGAEKLGKKHLVQAIAAQTGLSLAASAGVFDTVIAVVCSQLHDGGGVSLPGLGTLTVRPTPERHGFRPGTNHTFVIPAGRKVRFKVASDLKRDL